MTRDQVEERVRRLGYRYMASWRASAEDVLQGQVDRYAPACNENDLLVKMIGFDLGSEEWVENWGDADA